MLFRCPTSFSYEKSEKLAPLLLQLAARYRSSNDPADEPVVYAAIRTGASMLRSGDAHQLLPLLEPGYSIETSLIALKMIGRVFQAQPPSNIDQHPELAAEVNSVARSLLNPYVISVSQSAAMAQLAVFAVAAMASTHALELAQTIENIGASWFARRALRKLRNLEQEWASESAAAADAPRELLNQVIDRLQSSFR